MLVHELQPRFRGVERVENGCVAGVGLVAQILEQRDMLGGILGDPVPASCHDGNVHGDTSGRVGAVAAAGHV